eukprot:TRINITY_DN22012_c0_g1_i1.p1 TRINITY_DN22012_c0_g1~~TRINITY_DN22012_c0_g1_i1.p1  ORF type:complete len:324 (+),score=59.68 TRINITY_DN22012_c0_g1_i1:80-1051(+)
MAYVPYDPTNDDLYPRNPGQPVCASFVKKGRCAAFDRDSKCPWDHAVDDLDPGVLCVYLDHLDNVLNAPDPPPNPRSRASSQSAPPEASAVERDSRCWYCGSAAGGLIRACACTSEFEMCHAECLDQFLAATGFSECSLCGESYPQSHPSAREAVASHSKPAPKMGERDPWEEPLTEKLLEGADEIWEGIYLGSMEAAADSKALRQAEVSSVIDISRRENPRFKQQVEYLELNIRDHPEEDIRALFDEALRFIRYGLRQGSVLIHCKFGRSRSATLVIAYLMKYERLSYREALTLCVSRRNTVRPNSGFITQLLDYEKELGFH